MRPLSLHDRTLGALQLQPMTVAQLARCLSVSTSGAVHAIHALRDAGLVKIRGRHREHARPAWLWGLA